MDFAKLGRTGIRVSRLCLGTMSFGSYADPTASRTVFSRARDRGINFFDCANSYAGTKAESILGDCIADAGCRNEIVLISKVCRPTAKDVNGQGLSRRHILLEVENSLRRLKTDRIDVYFAHHYDPLTPAEETLRALDDLQRQGKIVHAGVSNWAAWRIARALGICERQGLARFEVVQPMYNLVKRQPEVELLPMAEAEQLGVVVYSPLASGLLSGAYGVGRAPAKARLDEPRYRERYGERSNYETADRFSAFAAALGHAPTALAVAWAMSHPAVTAPIIGAETAEQVDGYVDALKIPMTPELRAEVSLLSLPSDETIERAVD